MSDSFFKVGKYEVKAWAMGRAVAGVRQMQGHWMVTSPDVSEEPVAKSVCSAVRAEDGVAITDAMTVGREAARALIAQED